MVKTPLAFNPIHKFDYFNKNNYPDYYEENNIRDTKVPEGYE